VREYLLTLLVSAGFTYLLTPLVRRGAVRVGAIHAARDRDVHVVPIPLLGGLAMYAGLAAGLIVASHLDPLQSVFAGTHMETGLLLAGGLLVAVGFVDDRWGLNPLSKLAGQVAAGVIVVYSGAQIAWLPEPSGGTLALTPNQSIALTVLVVVITINAVNFIDGLDGLAAGIVAIAAISFFIYYYSLTRVVGLSAEAGPALAAAVLAGICLGFLPHNFYPARIFMGDTGAMLLGLLLAYAVTSSIASLDPAVLAGHHAYDTGTVNRFPEVLPVLLPAAILVIPYADMLLAVVRRTRAGMPLFAPDRKHLHHRLLDIGHSHRSSVLIMYLWAALFSGTVVWLGIAETQLFVFALITVAAVLVLLLMSMPRLRWWQRGHGTAVSRARAASTPPVLAAPTPAPVLAAPVPAASASAATVSAAPASSAAAPLTHSRDADAAPAEAPAPARPDPAAIRPAGGSPARSRPADGSSRGSRPGGGSPSGTLPPAVSPTLARPSIASRTGAQPSVGSPTGARPAGAFPNESRPPGAPAGPG
jgi:UDP-GlcNAc:undecaprenyl-phosphate GlcNAc-1-phosphate transferase